MRASKARAEPLCPINESDGCVTYFTFGGPNREQGRLWMGGDHDEKRPGDCSSPWGRHCVHHWVGDGCCGRTRAGHSTSHEPGATIDLGDGGPAAE
jgi:hypothetical protein